jgi:hypothetical protein
MPERVVDAFESVEIEERHGERDAVALAAAKRALGVFEEGAAIGNARQWVAPCRVDVAAFASFLAHQHEENRGRDGIDQRLEVNQREPAR